MSFDSTNETKKHILKVGENINRLCDGLLKPSTYKGFESATLIDVLRNYANMAILTPDRVVTLMQIRRLEHDKSKLEEPEKSFFDIETPKLRNLTYGSPEYQQSLDNLRTALEHHYSINRHHPEHFKNGMDGMSAIDIAEMFCDWEAASKRQDNGEIHKSIEINKKRFRYSDQLANIFHNTAEKLKS